MSVNHEDLLATMRRTLLRETALFRKYSLASSHEILSLGASFTQLRGQGMLKVEGPDTAAFLQGLITQDIKLLNSFETVYTGWLSNKGRMLYGSILSRPASGEIYIHLPREQVSELQSSISRFKLRNKVTLSDVSALFDVWAVMNPDGSSLSLAECQSLAGQGHCFTDPRCPALGTRVVLPVGARPRLPEGYSEVSSLAYDALVMTHGLPTALDVIQSKTIPLEVNLDYLNGVSFNKGCYLGQELTARTHFRGLVRKRLFPCLIFPAPPPSAQAKDLPRSPFPVPLPRLASLPFHTSKPGGGPGLFPAAIAPSNFLAGSCSPRAGLQVCDPTTGKLAGVISSVFPGLNVCLARLRLDAAASSSGLSILSTSASADGDDGVQDGQGATSGAVDALPETGVCMQSFFFSAVQFYVGPNMFIKM